MSEREKILDKIRKLRAMAESAQQTSTEEEARAFAVKVQELVTRYKIEEAELREISGEDQNNPIVQIRTPHDGFTKYAGKKSTAEGFPFKQTRVEWSEKLGSIVAKMNYCRMLVIPGVNTLVFVGRRVEAQAAVDTFVYLAAVAERVAWVEYQIYFDECAAEGCPEKARGFRKSFLLGFVDRLTEKYEQRMSEMRSEWLQNNKALVVLRDALREVDDYVASNIKTRNVKRAARTVANASGFMRGREVANGIGFGSKKVTS